MNWRHLFLIGGPLAFGYYLHRAGSAAQVVDDDVFSAFMNLLIAFPIGLFTAFIYATAIGDWFGQAVWVPDAQDPESDNPHWLVTLTGKLNHKQRYFLLRWICFLAAQLTVYSKWAVIYRRGMAAAKPGSWMEKYFATFLYPFPNAFDALKAAEVLRRHGVEPKAHPDGQIGLFILRAEMPDRKAKSEPVSLLPGDLEPVSEPSPKSAEKKPRKTKSKPGLMRNKAIALFEGAEPGGPIWKTHGREPKVGSPYEDRKATTVLFVAPTPAPIPFKPVRLPHQRRDRSD